MAAGLFLGGVVRLVGEHAVFSATAATAFLTADLLVFGTVGVTRNLFGALRSCRATTGARGND